MSFSKRTKFLLSIIDSSFCTSRNLGHLGGGDGGPTNKLAFVMTRAF